MRAFGSRGTPQPTDNDFDDISKKGPIKGKVEKPFPVGKAAKKKASKKSRPLTYFGQHTT